MLCVPPDLSLCDNHWANTLTNDLFQLCKKIFAVPACQKL